MKITDKNKKVLLYLVYTFTAISFCLSVFFFVKMQEENSLLDEFINQTLAQKKLTSLEDTVLTISNAIYNQTNGWVNREDMDWYSRWEATGFFKMSTGVGLKYKCYGVTGHPGDGPCGTMTKIFLRAMWDLGIPARKLQLMEVIPGKGGHTMAEFFNGKKWCVISPSDSSFVWRKINGEIASVKEIQSDTSIFNQVYYKWKPDWPYGFKKTWNINWEKIPSPLRSTIRFFIGEEAYRNAETPRLYEEPRKLLFLTFAFIFILSLLILYLIHYRTKTKP